MTDNDLMDAEQLGRRLGLTEGTVRSWAAKGLIPCLRPTPKVLRFEFSRVLQAIRQGQGREPTPRDPTHHSTGEGLEAKP